MAGYVFSSAGCAYREVYRNRLWSIKPHKLAVYYQ